MTRLPASHLKARLALAATIACAADGPAFETRVLDPNVGNVCYAVASADVDGDKKPDLVAVTENRVVWFQNPSWKLRVMIARPRSRCSMHNSGCARSRASVADTAVGSL